MKLPRWLVLCLLGSSLLAVLAAAGWWWLAWPERTAHAFVDLLADGKIEQARSMSAVPNSDGLDLIADLEDRRSAMARSRLESPGRTLSELVNSRQRFVVPIIDFSFTVQRGTVVQQSLGSDDMHAHLVAVHKLFRGEGAPTGRLILADSKSKSSVCASCHSNAGSFNAIQPPSDEHSGR